ncbi:MAG: hypothetical protein GY898_22450 [Proteobacteria bacterium]|nr:hypothetical protein [Pseudomonadota bacterium]
MMNKLLCLLSVLALVACDVEVAPSDDAAVPATRIDGTVSVGVDQGYPYGPAVLFRYSCDDPPPPIGSGRPVDFLVLPETAFVNGMAPFTFPAVPPDTCSILGGFIDRDRNFHYAFAVTGQPTQDDVTMGFVTVLTGSADGDWIEPITDVELEAETVETHDRPSFALPNEAAGDDDDSAAEADPIWPSLELDHDAEELQRNFLDINTASVTSSLVEAEAPIFKVILGTDEDGNGTPDDDNGDGLPDVDWPRVLLFRLDPDNPTKLTESDPRVVMPAVVLPYNPFAPLDEDNNLLDQAELLGVPLDGETVILRETLKLVIPDLVIVQSEPLILAPIEEIIASGTEVTGEYRFLVMNPNGQLWYTPNELAAEVELQSATFSVIDPEAG